MWKSLCMLRVAGCSCRIFVNLYVDVSSLFPLVLRPVATALTLWGAPIFSKMEDDLNFLKMKDNRKAKTYLRILFSHHFVHQSWEWLKIFKLTAGSWGATHCRRSWSPPPHQRSCWPEAASHLQCCVLDISSCICEPYPQLTFTYLANPFFTAPGFSVN